MHLKATWVGRRPRRSASSSSKHEAWTVEVACASAGAWLVVHPGRGCRVRVWVAVLLSIFTLCVCLVGRGVSKGGRKGRSKGHGDEVVPSWQHVRHPRKQDIVEEIPRFVVQVAERRHELQRGARRRGSRRERTTLLLSSSRVQIYSAAMCVHACLLPGWLSLVARSDASGRGSGR